MADLDGEVGTEHVHGVGGNDNGIKREESDTEE